jgi:hypothetical protein
VIVDCCSFLSDPDGKETFNNIDPASDHHQWSSKSLDVYYACVEHEDCQGQKKVVYALRAAAENLNIPGCSNENDSSNKKRKLHTEMNPLKRFLIDDVYTTPAYRKQSLAGLLVNAVLGIAASSDAQCYVLSLQNSAVYWIEKLFFFLVQSPGLTKLLNVFPDTHLLKRRVSAVEETGKGSTDGGGGSSQAHKDRNNEDEAEALARVRLEEQAGQQSHHNSSDTDNSQPVPPPDEFIKAMKSLLDMKVATPHEEFQTCLKWLATVIQNAIDDDSDEGRK